MSTKKFKVGDRLAFEIPNQPGTYSGVVEHVGELYRLEGVQYERAFNGIYFVADEDDGTSGGWLNVRLADEAPKPSKHAERKAQPAFTGFVSYFPDAINYGAKVSLAGNKQHHDGKPLHWEFDKSTDHGDCILRHQEDFDELDDDGLLHAGKVFWRAGAQLQKLLEQRDPELHKLRKAQRQRAAKGERK